MPHPTHIQAIALAVAGFTLRIFADTKPCPDALCSVNCIVNMYSFTEPSP
jgi:hypothetical protein